MKAFLRDNPTIAFGLGLPLVLVLIFLLIAAIPSLLVAPPQYEIVYVTEYYNQQSGVQISVVNNRVQVVYQGSVLNNQKPHLWRYDPRTGAVREIAYLLPPGLKSSGHSPGTPEDASRITPITIPELGNLTVDSSTIAPDGYEVSVGADRYGRTLFGDLFYSSRYRHEVLLKKGGRSIRLPGAAGPYYSGSTRFIGWVMSP